MVLSLHFSINTGWSEGGGPTCQHGGVISGQEHRHTLPQVPYCVALLPSCGPGQLPPELGQRLQSSLVPPPKGVSGKGEEVDPLCLAAVPVLPHFGVMSMGYP